MSRNCDEDPFSPPCAAESTALAPPAPCLHGSQRSALYEAAFNREVSQIPGALARYRRIRDREAGRVGERS